MFALVGINTKLLNGHIESLWYPALLVVLAENDLEIQIIVGRCRVVSMWYQALLVVLAENDLEIIQIIVGRCRVVIHVVSSITGSFSRKLSWNYSDFFRVL